MKLFTLFFLFSSIAFQTLNAQYIINEDFEGATPANEWYYFPETGNLSNRPSHVTTTIIFDSQSLGLKGNGNYVVTPLLPNPDQLSFFYKRSSNANAWSASIEILDAFDIVIATLPDVINATTTAKEYTADLSSYQNIKIKITDLRSSGTAELRVIDSFTVTQKPIIPCEELFFSEYIEGSSNNKYLEIYNPTSNTITLNDGANDLYRVGIFRNGESTLSGTGTFLFPANSSIPAYGTVVLKHTSASIYSGTAIISSGNINFTGNDAIVLQKNIASDWENIDIIGSIGEDPGTAWTGTGLYSTTDRTLIRRPEVNAGVKVNPIEGFPTLESEWLVYPIDEIHNLGNHISTCIDEHYTMIDSIQSYRYCNNDTIIIHYSAKGTYPAGNTFTFQISDDIGDFSSPIDIATVAITGTDIHQQLMMKLPNILTTAHYHLRIISNQPDTKSLISIQGNQINFIKPEFAYFRSKKNGNWKDADVWEVSIDSIYWENSCVYPLFPYSKSTNISSDHTIQIPVNDKSIHISNLKILENSILSMGSGATLEIENSTGTDFIVEGTFEDNAGSGTGIDFKGSSTWSLGENGTIIKTSNSGVAGTYRDHYEGGISNIPATANWIYRLNNNLSATTNLDMFYPNLHFENSGENSIIYTLTGKNGFMTVKGSLYIGSLIGNVLTVSNQNSNATATIVNGNVIIYNNGIYTNVKTGANDPGTGLNIYGDITNDGQITLNNNDIGHLQLSGHLEQEISGSGTFNIRDIYLSKTPQSIAVLNTDLEVKNQLHFEGGIINSNGHELYISNGALNAIIGYDEPNGTGLYNDDKYVIGKLKRNITESNSTYIFPIGVASDDIAYNPARLTFKSIPAGNNTASGEFVHSWPGAINTLRKVECDGTSKFIEYTGLTNEGYWKFEGSTFTDYQINLHPNILNINVLPNENSDDGHKSNYRALKDDIAHAGSVWESSVAVLGDYCKVSDNYYDIVGSGYTGFSIFAPGGGNGNTTALPVELLSFDITCGDFPTLEWITASEKNTDFFRIESSKNGSDFLPIGQINAAGNSHQNIKYTYTLDNDNTSAYFRLVETDLDGNIYYHKIIENKCFNTTAKTQAFYHPQIGIQIPSGNTNSEVYIYNISGKNICQKSLTPQTLPYRIGEAINWVKGIYIINIITQSGHLTSRKVMVY